MSSTVSAFSFARHRTTCRFALILAAAGACTTPASLTAADSPRTTITVRVYQIAGVPYALEHRALAEAEAVLQSARVDVSWQECTGPNPSAACHEPRGRSELLLIVREGADCQAASAPLGEAFLVPGASDGLATVYFSCVAQLATRAKTDVAVLLGRVAAHELGHLMIGTPTHSHHGVMRPFWGPDELRRNRAADWAFTAKDVAAMREPRLEHRTEAVGSATACQVTGATQGAADKAPARLDGSPQ